jgi:hypothetical protein
LNLAELRQEVYDALDDEFEETSLRFPQTMIDEFINDGTREMVVRSNCLIGTLAITPEVGRFDYQLPSDCINVLRVYRTDALEKVWPMDLADLDLERPGWQKLTSNRFEWYFFLGLDVIYLGPPFGSTTTRTYEVTYAADPGETPLASDTSEPGFDESYQSNLIDYAVSRSFMIDGTEAQLAGAVALYKNFAKGWKRLREETFSTLDRRFVMREADPTRADYGVIPTMSRHRATR